MIDPHFHKQDRVEEKDLIPDGTYIDVVPDYEAPEGTRVHYLNGSVYRLYVMIDGEWRDIGTAGSGTMALQDANNVAITGGTIFGITDLAVADGGTGASTAATARSNLGLGALAVEDDVTVAEISAATLVTEAEGISSNDDDVHLPTTAAVKDYVDDAIASTPASTKISIITTPVTVTNTTTETNLISLAIPANTLGTDNGVKARLWINNFDNGGAGAGSITLRVKYGGTTHITNGGFETNTNQLAGFIDVFLLGKGATNSQRLTAILHFLGTRTTQNPTGAPDAIFDQSSADATIDSTASQTLTVSIQWSAASASNILAMDWAIIEKIS
jgi:hypothetical protein